MCSSKTRLKTISTEIAYSNIKKKICTKAILMKFFKISLLFLIIIFSINQSKYKVFNIISKKIYHLLSNFYFILCIIHFANNILYFIHRFYKVQPTLSFLHLTILVLVNKISTILLTYY